MTDQAARQRASEAQRLEVVDALRGFALSGLFLVHMIECYELYWADPKPGWVADTVLLLLMGKSFSLLALCFGFSFFILMDRAARRGTDFSLRFAWRLLILEGIGCLHALIYRGDIIQALALIGFVLLLAHRVRSNRALLAMAAFCFVGPSLIVQIAAAASGAGWADRTPHFFEDSAMPTYLTGSLGDVLRVNLGPGQASKWWFYLESGRVVQILGLFLLGMVAGRTGFFERLGDFARGRAIALGVAVVATLALYFARAPLGAAFATLGYGTPAGIWFGMLTSGWLDLAATAVWALLLMAVYQSGWRGLLRPFAAMGRLTLTLYIAQSLVFVPVFYGFGLGLYDDLSQPVRLGIGLVAVAAQMWIATAWLKRYHYGPLEWAWRALTYWTRDIPFRRKPA